MIRLKPWQWGVLVLPIAAVVGFVLIAAGAQIHTWGLSWIWAVFVLLLVGWRWLLVRWTQPAFAQLESVVAEVQEELEAATEEAVPVGSRAIQQAEAALEQILQQAQADPPLWQDWNVFWQRCRDVVIAVSRVYHPEVKYPLLNIYVPEAYGLMRGTVDDLDQWMEKLTPVLGQLTVGQAVEGYEVYQRLEPSARKLWQAWNWAQWVFNPAVAVARTVSQPANNQATQQLLGNLSQLLREATLRNLYRQAVALYGGKMPVAVELTTAKATLPQAKTQTLREILDQAEPVKKVEQKPINILLVGRTGAGKSSLINTLFEADRAEVDVLPSTDQIKSYYWQGDNGETLTLWDSPGYEQVSRSDFREQVLDYAHEADLLLLATPALDPALQMDVDFLRDMKIEVADLPAIATLTQVDRLRPLREWAPPYDWRWGERPKEKSIREATQYRIEQFGDYCDRVLPIVTADAKAGRTAWNADALSLLLVESLDPAKQLRLARFLRNREARIVSAAKTIDHYTFQMTTTQGVASLLKSPVLQFVAIMTTGNPALGYALAEQIPIEQLPTVIGKLQMAYDLAQLLGPENAKFDLLALWPVLLENPAAPDRNAWAFGHALVEYWTQGLSIDQLRTRFNHYLEQAA
ncbi:GTPase [Pseudanabaena sp. FACHB-2040]|uniref:GTPase family protein n=1 Tax=Pseudanabaena sp. FACHB-2040 TaxID=2692859 RepID=UPI001689B6A7|nr:GTPase [Pseudanabaena sp. FACHB-2040]MBD2259635.1 50S ribosome-binding GTPase [Pseudanabaena sp. FACHB-2040]